jgi:hypothetical protein
MKKYLVLYRSPVSADEQMAGSTPEDAQAGMEAWMTWAGKAGSAIVDLGSPLSSVADVGSKPDNGNFIGGFSVLQAESAAAVEKLLDGHPHLQMPGDASIQVLEYLPIPGM